MTRTKLIPFMIPAVALVGIYLISRRKLRAKLASQSRVIQTAVGPAEKADLLWGTGDLRPISVTDSFCRLMEESGCFYANLSIESASEKMLRSMKRGYTVQQVRDSLEALSRSKIPFGASLMLGAPGETPETIAETLDVLDDYELPNGVWVTIGVYLWTDYQDIVAEARRTGDLKDHKELFSGAVYLSPGLPKSYLCELPETLRARQNFFVQFNKPSESWTLLPIPNYPTTRLLDYPATRQNSGWRNSVERC